MAHCNRAVRLLLNPLRKQWVFKQGAKQISTSVALGGAQGKTEEPRLRMFKKRVEILKDKEIQGVFEEERRSSFPEWNYGSELYAFCHRLSEQVEDKLLRIALTDSLYVFDQKKKLEEAGLENSIPLESNEELAAAGLVLTKDFVEKFIRWSWPCLPEEGVQSIRDHLCKEDSLCQAASSMGFRELLLSREYPPSPSTYAKSLLALISAINQTKDLKRCQKFILDFVVVQTTSKDIWDMWPVEDAFSHVSTILVNNGRGAPEPRIIDTLGESTIEAVFYVGIYSDKVFMGNGFGETYEIAKQVASLDCLGRFFNVPPSRDTLKYGQISDEVALKGKPHPYIKEWQFPKKS